MNRQGENCISLTPKLLPAPPPKKKEGRKELRRKKEEKKCTFLFVLVYGVQWRDQQKMKRWGWGGRQGIDQEESYI